MGPTVRTVSVGSPREGILRRGSTAIDKRSVPSVAVRDPGPKLGGLGSGVVGDDVVSRKHHGGSLQAVYAVAREELDWWGTELGRTLRDGMFGENLTTEGINVDGAVMGEQWQVGGALLEVCGPRIPCATFAAWMQEKGWVKRFAARGQTGAYLAVVEPGTISAGDEVLVLTRPDHGVTVPDMFRAVMGDLGQARRVLDAHVLGADDQADLERVLTRRTR
ncbi:MAG: MOSC domain-containing protein [Ornithinibacter sp.]